MSVTVCNHIVGSWTHVKCLSVDVCIYGICAFLNCHVDVDVCIYSTSAFLIVMFMMLMLIMCSAVSL